MAAKVMDQSSQLFVNWTAVQGVGNCVVTYRITWRPVSESDGGGTSYTTSLSYTITQLEAWTTYQRDLQPSPGYILQLQTLYWWWGAPREAQRHHNKLQCYLEHVGRGRCHWKHYPVQYHQPGACTLYNIIVKAATIKGYGDGVTPVAVQMGTVSDQMDC
ncbi:hypothetical protein Hamer_G005347, partial [Homarus americanus]